jgi:HEAT repeat protein
MKIRPLPICLTVAFFLIFAPHFAFGAASGTQAWIEVLQSDASVFEKVRACQQLGEFGSKEAVPALASLLDHPQLSSYARTGLERIPGTEAREALRTALEQVQGKRLIGVIHSLAALRDEGAVPALIALTHDADPDIVKAALLALGRVANSEAISVVRQALNFGTKNHRADAAAACLLAAQTQMAQDKTDIAQGLYDTVRLARVPASYRIGATRGAIVARQSDQVAFLIRQLHSDDPAIRDVALLTIREIPSDALATALNAKLDRAHPALLIPLLSALKDCHNAQSIQALRTQLQSQNPAVRLAALRTLRDIGDSDSASTFLKVLRDNRSVEELAIAKSSLEFMQGADVDDLILETLGASSDAETRIQLIRLLALRHVTSATDALLRQANAPDAKVSIAAFQALKSLAGPAELPRLIALTRAAKKTAVRDAAVAALYSVCKNSKHIEQNAALMLQELNNAHSSTEKSTWIRVLAMLGYAPALPAITATLQDADPQVVQSTISQLGRWPDPAPIDDLFAVVEGDANSNTRTRALLAVLQLATNAANQRQATDEELLVWFQRAHKAVHGVQEKRLLISGLGRVKHIQAVQLLASYLDDAQVKTEAVHAIVNASGPLVKGQDYRAVEVVLKRISGIQDKRLLNQIAKLQRDIQLTGARTKE